MAVGLHVRLKWPRAKLPGLGGWVWMGGAGGGSWPWGSQSYWIEQLPVSWQTRNTPRCNLIQDPFPELLRALFFCNLGFSKYVSKGRLVIRDL